MECLRKAYVKRTGIAIIMAAMLCFSAIPAQAVAVKRVDSFIEVAMHAFEMEMKAWLMNTAMSVLKVNSIQDLINLPSRLANVFKNFDVKGLLSSFGDTLLQAGMAELNGVINEELAKLDIDLDIDVGNLDSLPGQLLAKVDEELSKELSKAMDKIKIDLGLNEIGQSIADAQKAMDNFKKNVEDAIAKSFTETKPGSGMYYANTDLEKQEYIDPNDGNDPGGPADPYDPDDGDIETQQQIAAANASLSRPTYTKTDIEKMVKKAAENTATYMEEITATVPKSIASVQEAIVKESLETMPNEVLRDSYILGELNSAKWTCLTKIGQISAKYADKKDSSYRNVANSIMQKNNEIIANAMKIANGGPGDALPSIAGLTAVQVQQLNLQNSILIEMEDILADQIRILGTIGMMEAEGYASRLSENMGKYYDIYGRTKSQMTRK